MFASHLHILLVFYAALEKMSFDEDQYYGARKPGRNSCKSSKSVVCQQIMMFSNIVQQKYGVFTIVLETLRHMASLYDTR